jgi:hypothetical protein
VQKGRGDRVEPNPPVVWGCLRRCIATVPVVAEGLPCNFWSFRDYFVNFKLLMEFLFSCFKFIFCIVDVKKKEKEKKRKRKGKKENTVK